MEIEIIVYEKKEEFTSYQISQLIVSDFGKQLQKTYTFISISPIMSPLVTISSLPATFTSLFLTFSLLALGLIHTFIYSI